MDDFSVRRAAAASIATMIFTNGPWAHGGLAGCSM